MIKTNTTMEGRRFFDYIVIGCGGIGSAAVYWLSKRAHSGVLGLEQFELGHENGGSQDHSRIIRMAYHDDIYTKLTPDTYKAFEEAERESGIQVVFRTGGVLLAQRKMEHHAKKYAEAMSKHNISYEWMTGSQLHQKFPQFETDDSYVAVYQSDGGLVDAARANAVHIQLARGNGATLIDNCPVTNLTKDSQGITTVHTTKGTFYCRKVIVTSGAWVNHVLGSVGVHIPIYVTQEQVTYFGTPNMKDYVKEKFPIWIYHSDDHDFYGLPIHGNTGSKIGIDAGGPTVTPQTRTFTPDPVREKACIDLLQQILPSSLGPILYSKTCLYTMPPDRNFVIDTCHASGWKDVIVCNGAGHAYKVENSVDPDKITSSEANLSRFTVYALYLGSAGEGCTTSGDTSCCAVLIANYGLLGKILSEMAIDGRTNYDISPFTLDREALKDPEYKPTFYMGTGEEQANNEKDMSNLSRL